MNKYLNKSDDDLLHISDEVIQSNGEAAVTLGNALSYICYTDKELQTVYTQQ